MSVRVRLCSACHPPPCPCATGTTSEEGVIFVYGVFRKPVSVMESMAYATAIFKQHTFTVLHKYLPMYLYTDRRTMLSQVCVCVCPYVCVCVCLSVVCVCGKGVTSISEKETRLLHT